jgi:probable F420-dependent oxidoreductase
VAEGNESTAASLRYWVPLMFEPMDQYLELGRIMDGLGYEGAGLADHVAIPARFESVHPSGDNPFTPESEFPDPLTLAPAMIAVTERLKVMSYVYVLSMRDPLLAAKQVGTLAALFPERFCLGIGAGWLTEEIASVGVDPSSRGRRMDEMLTVMRQAWDTGWIEHHGDLLTVERTAMFPVPPVRPPVWVGGKSDAALRRAVRQDGWLGMNYAMDEVESLVARLRQLRDDAGDERTDAEFEVFVIPNAMPSAQLYADLAGMGVTSTMVMPWAPGDPSVTSLEAKRERLEATAAMLGLT